jgi:hypothetical protein
MRIKAGKLVPVAEVRGKCADREAQMPGRERRRRLVQPGGVARD